MISWQSHPTMMFFVFSIPSASIYGLDSTFLSTYASTHIEHEKCLVRLPGSLDFSVAFLIFLALFSLFTTALFSPTRSYPWHVGVFLIPCHSSLLFGRHWPDYLPSCFRWLLSVSVLSSLLLEKGRYSVSLDGEPDPIHHFWGGILALVD